MAEIAKQNGCNLINVKDQEEILLLEYLEQ